MALPDLMGIKGIGPAYHSRVVEGMKQQGLSLEQVYQFKAQEIKQKFGLPINAARSIATAYKPEIIPEKMADTKKANKSIPSVSEPITSAHYIVVNRNADSYPARLQAVLGEKAPQTLYMWGNLDLLSKPGVGFCGSRDVTDKGLAITRDISEQVVKQDWVTISGHARGVDIVSHLTALENGASTIIVLPEGIDGFKVRMQLRKYVTNDNILIISEFPPNAAWNVGYAMQRNSTIIGLSYAMVLIESRESGGTFNAGKEALRLKQPLFVVKFQDIQKSNAGNDYFLNEGALQLMKSKTTNKANISPLIDKVIEGQNGITAPSIHEKPRQMSMSLAENS